MNTEQRAKMLKHLIDAYIDLNKIKSSEVGQKSSELASNMTIIKKHIATVSKCLPPLESLPEFLHGFITVISINSAPGNHNHMIGDSIFFLRKMINLKIKEVTK